MTEIFVVPTGLANLASVKAAFRRLGCKISEVKAAGEIESADFVVLPGVGSYGPGMEVLKSQGLDASLLRRIKSDSPTLGVCLGFQLLGAASEEAPGVEGLCVHELSASHFPENCVTPQFGWNRVLPAEGSSFIEREGYAYFANSYYFAPEDNAWKQSTAVNEIPFIAAMEKGRVLACQFHPELSGDFGESILKNWVSQ